MADQMLTTREGVPRIIPPLLSFTAGFLDSFTFLALYGLFVAQVTGSFVLAAAAIVTNEQGALTKLLAIPVFLLAAVATTSLAVMLERRGRAPLAWLLGLECAVLTGFLLTALIGAPLSDPNAASVTAASLLGLFTMGTQSATVRLLLRDVASTNVMTTNTTQIGIDASELVFAWQARRPARALVRCLRSCSASWSGRRSAPWLTWRPGRGACCSRSRSCTRSWPGRARGHRIDASAPRAMPFGRQTAASGRSAGKGPKLASTFSPWRAPSTASISS